MSGEKAKRKISLPWFRQSSVSSSHAPLARQHTIDTPSSFQARLLRRQPSHQGMAGVVEMTWVINDHVAASGTQELTVRKGQQVEVVEISTTRPDYCVVRMPTQGPDLGAVPEGLVPINVLKPQPSLRASPSRRQPNLTAAEHEGDAVASDSSGTINTSSPVNKRRGFSSKWLPPPLRKLSQGKVEKGQSNASTDRPPPPPLKKTGSDKRFKLPSEMGSKPANSEGDGEGEDDSNPLTNGGPDEPEEEVELPPPMKPLQEPLLVTQPPTQPPTVTTTIPEDSREQHTENQERHSFLRDKNSTEKVLTECEEVPESDLTEGGSSSGENDSELALRKREFVIKELADSEETYVKDLAQITEGYLGCMRDPNFPILLPDDLKGTKQKMVFGNIEQIYEWHRDFFSKALRRCVDHPAELGPLFRRCERKLHMYVVYCQNKPVSEHIVSEYLDNYFEELRTHLGHKLQICDLLIKPVQRITKYQLLLKEALSCTERGNCPPSEIATLRGAVHVMHVVPKAANDMMDVGRLQGFDGKLSAQGRLLLHGPLLCSETPTGPRKEYQVFLFEQAVIFSDAVGKKTQFTSPVYVYKAHLQVNKMMMEESGGVLHLRSTDPRRPGLQFTCEAITPELRTQWQRTLHAILQTQKDFLKAIQSPIAYQKELTKDA